MDNKNLVKTPSTDAITNKKLTVSVPEETLKDFKQLTRKNSTNMASLVRGWIEDYMDFHIRP